MGVGSSYLCKTKWTTTENGLGKAVHVHGKNIACSSIKCSVVSIVYCCALEIVETKDPPKSMLIRNKIYEILFCKPKICKGRCRSAFILGRIFLSLNCSWKGWVLKKQYRIEKEKSIHLGKDYQIQLSWCVYIHISILILLLYSNLHCSLIYMFWILLFL